MKNKRVLLGIVCFLFIISSIIGCNDPNYGYVTGKVLIDGELAQKGLVVRFHPQVSGGSFSTGITDDQGNYEMHFSITKKGVQVGSNKITVEYPEGDGLPKTPEFLNKYNESSLVYNVKSGRQNYDIKIDTKSKK
jgi:hypothetical protein